MFPLLKMKVNTARKFTLTGMSLFAVKSKFRKLRLQRSEGASQLFLIKNKKWQKFKK